MLPELETELKSWLEIRGKTPGIETDHVFVCLDDTPFCEQYYGKPFQHRQHLMQRLCKKAQVKPFGFHAIRHLTATTLYSQGYSVAVIQSLLRHQSPNTTERYLRSLGLMDDAVREALQGALGVFGTVSPPTNKKPLKVVASKG